MSSGDIEFLIDNHDAWKRLTVDLQAAQRSVRVLLFYLDVGECFVTFDPDPPVPGKGRVQGTRLEQVLADAGARGVQVQVVYNDAVGPDLPPLVATDTARAVARYFEDRANVTVRPFRTSILIPIHAKLFVIDDEIAYTIGSPFVSDYYDAQGHVIDDPRRGSWSRWPWRHQQIRVPVHDVSARVAGPLVAELAKTFWLHWDMLGEHPESPTQPPSEASGTTVIRTLCGNGRYASYPSGERGILDAYLAAIASAERFIYLENQYVLCPEIGTALRSAMQRSSSLQLIVLMNTQVDLPLYGKWQLAFLNTLLGGLSEQQLGRIGLFTLWSHDHRPAAGTPPRVLRNYVHSKVAVVDDSWGTIGSANLDSVSLSQSDYALRVPALRLLMRWWKSGVGPDPRQARAMEVNLGLGGADAARLRSQLWQEHLGETAATSDDLLGAWSAAAASTLACLQAPSATPCGGRVLRIPVVDGRVPDDVVDPEAFLGRLGVPAGSVELLETFPAFSFRRGDYEH
ncbi:hypothetical protein NOCA240048 [metagenome]|uniref:PLD phosphodiesterase domain-containing protein n=1 Tax=metagenome TaxID=256318 RepID=A0A2P2C5N8_9ZZZZ